jgi:hypothetical protein
MRLPANGSSRVSGQPAEFLTNGTDEHTAFLQGIYAECAEICGPVPVRYARQNFDESAGLSHSLSGRSMRLLSELFETTQLTDRQK